MEAAGGETAAARAAAACAAALRSCAALARATAGDRVAAACSSCSGLQLAPGPPPCAPAPAWVLGSCCPDPNTPLPPSWKPKRLLLAQKAAEGGRTMVRSARNSACSSRILRSFSSWMRRNSAALSRRFSSESPTPSCLSTGIVFSSCEPPQSGRPADPRRPAVTGSAKWCRRHTMAARRAELRRSMEQMASSCAPLAEAAAWGPTPVGQYAAAYDSGGLRQGEKQ